MVFTVLAACDLAGKCNYELSFAAKPSVSELRMVIDRDLGAEAALRRLPVPFTVSRVQVFDERLQMWVDLVAAVQLEDYCQLYVFQEEHFCADLPGHIPPPQRPASASMPPPPPAPPASHYDTRSVSPQRVRNPSPERAPVSAAAAGGMMGTSPFNSPDRSSSAAPSQADKVREVYDSLNKSRGSRGIPRDDWTAAFEELRLSAPEGKLSVETAEDLFDSKADNNKDSYVDRAEFSRFADAYPKLLDSMYYRKQALVHEKARKEGLERAHKDTENLENKKRDAEDAARDAESEALAHDEKVKEAEDAVGAAQDREKEAKAARDASQADLEPVRAQVRDAKAAADKERDAVRARDSELRGAQRDVAAQAKKRDAKQAEKDRAARELDRLRKLVEQKEAEVAKIDGELAPAEKAVDDAQAVADAKQADKDAAEAEAARKQADVAAAEAELRALLDRDGEQAREQRAKQQDVAAAKAEAEKQKKQQQQLKAKQDAKERAQQRAAQALEEQQKKVDELEARNAELEDKRKAQQAKEDDIIEGEIRLREQRDTMVKKETELRKAADEFAQESGRAASSSPQWTA